MYSQFETFPLLGDLLQIGFFGILIIGFFVTTIGWMYQKGKESGLKREKRRARLIAQELKALEGDK